MFRRRATIIQEPETQRSKQRRSAASKTFLLAAVGLLVAANAMAATSGTVLDAPVIGFSTILETTVAFLVFLVGIVVAVIGLWRHGDLSHTLGGAGASVLAGIFLGGATPLSTFFGFKGLLIG
jgi:hypothetical protein